MRKTIFIFSGVCVLLFGIYNFLFAPQRVGCVMDPERVALDTVHAGKFIEAIPFSASILRDSSSLQLSAELDQLYFSRVSLKMIAYTWFNGIEYSFAIIDKDSLVRNGRFNVTLEANEPAPKFISKTAVIRMRLTLAEIEHAVQLNVGGFYKDTGGKYVYVVLPDGKMVKRNVVLGRKNTECFEVLSGLVPGEVVITSTYENLNDPEDLDLESLRELYE
jgi:hypothetical protein